MRPTLLRAGSLVATVAALTSCSATAPTQDATPSPSVRATPPTGPAPSAATLWADATRSLAKRHTVHLHDWFGSDTGSSKDAPIVMDFDVTLDGTRIHGTQDESNPTSRREQLVIDGDSFDRFSDDELRSLAGHDHAEQEKLVDTVNGRWVASAMKTKPGDGPVRLVTHLLAHAHPARTAFAAKGTTVTSTTFSGRSAWKIRSADGHQRAWIAADPTHDVLRVESTAASTHDSSETIELSKFDVPFTVTKPRDTVPYSVIGDAMNRAYTSD